jgi:hypothetical protein
VGYWILNGFAQVGRKWSRFLEVLRVFEKLKFLKNR